MWPFSTPRYQIIAQRKRAERDAALAVAKDLPTSSLTPSETFLRATGGCAVIDHSSRRAKERSQ